MTFLYYQRCFYIQTLENTEGVIKNGESRETGNIGYTRHRTNKRQRIPKEQSKMENPEKLVTQGTQDTGQINVREYRRGNKKMENPEKLATQDTQDTGQIKVREYQRSN